MDSLHPKRIRRGLLTQLYERFLADPLEMLTPGDFLDGGTLTTRDLAANMHYLRDRGLVELLLGYNPPLFSGARITADGIDLVENDFEFNLRFPAAPGEEEEATAELPRLLEQLVVEADYAPLDGEARKRLLRDVQYLRDEIARPAERRRKEVIATVLDWIAADFDDPGEALPSLSEIRRLAGGRQ